MSKITTIGLDLAQADIKPVKSAASFTRGEGGRSLWQPRSPKTLVVLCEVFGAAVRA